MNNRAIGDTNMKTVTILNPTCVIDPNKEMEHLGWTLSNKEVNDDSGLYYTFTGVIRGYTGSTAQEYAEKCGYNFESIGDMPEAVSGDVNYDGKISVSDVIAVNQWIHKKSARVTNWKSADLNSDGVVNVVDLALLKKELLK